ncbi:MAG: dynamin family protein [Pseudomonadota bacterium]
MPEVTPLPVKKSTPASSSKPADKQPADGLAQELGRYQDWRIALSEALLDYQNWVEQQAPMDGEQDLRIYELIESLKSDKLTIALVAEYSRGKSELLNAIFFSDTRQRLLPASAGRTTMCPTELRYDEKDGACVRLLPIETRKTELTIAEYRRTPIHWNTIHLVRPNSAEELRDALKEITRTKKVHVRDAQELGLYDQRKTRRTGDPAPENDMLDIPVWRHAIINFPHPLLKQGLVILDTPGLNALGLEPELTLSMLPSAHVLIFVLAAEIGVSQTDLEVWNNHVPKAQRNSHLVVLNKIDTMWDELEPDSVITDNIAKQVETVAKTLQLDRRQVLPASAQKALIGRIKGDRNLVEKSGIESLENRLASELIPSRHQIVRDRIVHEVSSRIETSRALLQSRLGSTDRQLTQLREMRGKDRDTIQQLVAKVRAEKQKYDREVEGSQMTRALLKERANVLLSFMSLKSFDELIARTRQDMSDSWTTRGLKSAMETFFRGSAERMVKVAEEATHIRRTVEKIYLRLHTEYGMVKINPIPLSLSAMLIMFKRLESKADDFRNSPVTVMTEQHYVVQKFFITLVSQARQLFHDSNELSKNWFKAVVSPVYQQIQEHKDAIEKNFSVLKRIQENMDTLGDQLAELEETRRDIETQLTTTSKLLERLHQPL